MHSWEIARIAHEANRAYCQAIGDESQPAWEDAPDWQRESAHEGVMAIFEGRVTSPGDSHVSWLKHKTDEGWTWGPIKDPELKQHPCMVPFEELPAEQQVKDYLFVGLVQALLDNEIMRAESGAVLMFHDRAASAYCFGDRPHVEALAAGLRRMANDIETDPADFPWIH